MAVDVYFENKIKEYFDFLVTEYRFMSPIFYNIAFEYHAIYIKNYVFIDISFDGDYECFISKSKKIIVDDILSKKTSIKNIEFTKDYDLSILDSRKKLYNSIWNIVNSDKKLYYYAELLKQNSEILDGRFKRFSLWKIMLKIIENVFKFG